MFSLAAPWFLLLLPLPLLVRRWAKPYQAPRSNLQVPFLGRLLELRGVAPGDKKPSSAQSPGMMQWLVLMLSWILIVLACARPQWTEDPISRVVPSRDLLVAIDLSGSMETRDFQDDAGNVVDRVTAVKQVLDEFFARREGDRVGLMVFGNSPFILVPFTEDLQACRSLLDEMLPRMAGPRTMIGDAIGKAITVFEQSDLDEQVMILLTDGNDSGSLVPPVKAAEIAAQNDITIHVIAMGDPTSVGEDALDAVTLRDVASATGGEYFVALDRDSLEQVYDELDQLSTHELETLSYRPVSDLFYWPLGLCLLLVLGRNFTRALRQGWRQRPGSQSRSTQSRGEAQQEVLSP
jgi:Ca-activated chloride channel family protein